MNILEQIMERKRYEVAKRQKAFPLVEMEAEAEEASPVRGFQKALATAITDKEKYGIIAEIKKASPSQGVICRDFVPANLARGFESAGANCLSVLTDEADFQGSSTDLEIARTEVSIPVLRKDFLFDPYQIIESRAMGADCVLLIVKALSPAQVQELMAVAKQQNMDILVEVHDESEMEIALEAKAGLIGINNRNLATFEVDLSVTKRLAANYKDTPLLVSASGIKCLEDMVRLSKFGIRCFLIGEAMTKLTDSSTNIRFHPSVL